VAGRVGFVERGFFGYLLTVARYGVASLREQRALPCSLKHWEEAHDGSGAASSKVARTLKSMKNHTFARGITVAEADR
jgi:hypothetical protein